jgi:nicotinamidase-related amidase
MGKSILITVCLSNDMLCPLEKNEAPPNNLHIGYYETTRLLGTDWENGPLVSFLKSCYKDKDDLEIIHVRDWHDHKDPLQQRELEKYGLHCIKDSWGAEFIWENKKILKKTKKVHIVNSKKIMTATEPEFSNLLKKIIGKSKKEDVKIGIIGVLTNIKVSQMAISLQGFYDLHNLSVCSALTASTNIRRHFQGLDDLSNLYGVRLFDSIKQFGDWMNVNTKLSSGIKKFDTPKIKQLNSEKITKQQETITNYLFKECKNLTLEELSGGYSGSKVFLVDSVDRQGFEETPTILKLDRTEAIGKERMGFEKVQHVLGPHMPQILDSIETENGAGIRYSFAMMNKKSSPKTFKEFFMQLNVTKKRDKEKLVKCINTLCDEIFEPLYGNWILDQKQLWKANTFKVEYIGLVKDSITKILKIEPVGKKIHISGVGDFYNPLLFYTKDNLTKKLNEPVSYVRQSLAHGDLNAANIILDENFNMWLIDFFHTDYDYHTIQDVVKLENDLKFIHTPIKSKKELVQLIKFEKFLMSQNNLSKKLKKLPENLSKNKDVVRLYIVIKKLRGFAYKISADKNVYNYRIPQLRYVAHNLSFDESNHLQKTYALASTALLTEYFQKSKDE